VAKVNFGTRLSRYGAVETLYVSGELDIAAAPVLERAFNGALDGQGGEFRLDVGGLTFMDSSGAKSLMHLHNRVESVGRISWCNSRRLPCTECSISSALIKFSTFGRHPTEIATSRRLPSHRVSSLLLASYCVRDARLRRRTDALPLKSSGAFEFPKRLELREIVCDGSELPVAPFVCDRAQLNAHSVSAGEASCRVECAHSIEEQVLVDHHAPRLTRLGHA
jgi:anti-anti-sigma factor